MSAIPEFWRKNLYAIFVAEFIVITGVDFVNPFMPLFIQKLGNFTNEQAAFWAGIATASSGFAMFFTAPVWGILADRWGRKPMVLRAMFGTAVVLALTGLVPNVYYLVALRFVLGSLSGILAASSALIASITPRNRMPFAMGLLMAGAFGGQTFGPMFGGFLADSVGYRNTFFITSSFVFVGGFIVLLFVKEKFERPAKEQTSPLRTMSDILKARDILPVLLTITALYAGPKMISPIIPLLMGELDPGGRVASASGLAFGFLGIVAAISSLIAGRLGQRISLKKILVVSCLGTSLFYLPPMWAATVAQLLIFVALTGLFKGGLVATSNALVGLSVQPGQQGIAYGLAQSAKSLGNGFGPMIGGSLASVLGLRSIFGVGAILFFVVGLATARLLVSKPIDAGLTASRIGGKHKVPGEQW